MLRAGKHSNPILQATWNKYGEDDFKFEYVEVVTDKTELIAREQHWLDLLRPSFNISNAADCPGRGRPSHNKGRKIHTDAYKQRLADEKRGVKRPDLSAIAKGRKRPGIAALQTGQKHSEEWRANQSNGKKEWWDTESKERKQEIAAKISETLTGKTLSDSHREAISAGLKKAWQNRVGKKRAPGGSRR